MTVVSSYSDFVTVCRARRLAINMSQLELDDRIGWSSGYVGKIEAHKVPAREVARSNKRGLSMVTLFEVLQALGLQMEIVATDEATVPLRCNLDSRRRRILDPHLRAWHHRNLNCRSNTVGATKSDQDPSLSVVVPLTKER